MSDVALVAVISTSGTVLVALAGALGAIFGSSWRDAASRRALAAEASAALRYQRASEFVDALGQFTKGETWSDRVRVHEARHQFVAVLRAGEGSIQDYSRHLIEAMVGARDLKSKLSLVTAAADLIFEYLRGDLPVDSFVGESEILRTGTRAAGDTSHSSVPDARAAASRR